jgi:SAM-dependent methyltransferase
MTPVYRMPLLYEAMMVSLYRRYYADRFSTLASLIPSGVSVVEACCGPGVLFSRYLRKRHVRYMGLDLSPAFIHHLRSQGGCGEVWDLLDPKPLPSADYVVLQGSLCHFLPDARPLFERLLKAARAKLILSEPIRSIVNGRSRILAALGRHLTDPGNGKSNMRFTEERLDLFLATYANRLETSFFIPGGREKVYIFDTSGE